MRTFEPYKKNYFDTSNVNAGVANNIFPKIVLLHSTKTDGKPSALKKGFFAVNLDGNNIRTHLNLLFELVVSQGHIKKIRSKIRV